MDLGADNELVEQIFRLTREEQSFIQRELKQFGINILQARTLNFIAQHPAAIQKELSRYLSKQEATTTNILKALETKKLVERKVPAENERLKQLYLLPDGQVLVQKVRSVFIDLEKRVTAPLSGEEKQLMLRLLRRINDQVDLQ
ncbi:MarR family winged helix-turn-helix transcriptional regulator [Lacticaseibacillus hulanensis]|uniref:MarR family winged helix-turn-helix transcriptional regulator n=1 Tax=Lacticaseibacillus hulanensis TaxID=2493111 RepID=UPI000FD7414F|nr:MarR family transcriptional regulator [Lacticaseibacillus hulanensis]